MATIAPAVNQISYKEPTQSEEMIEHAECLPNGANCIPKYHVCCSGYCNKDLCCSDKDQEVANATSPHGPGNNITSPIEDAKSKSHKVDPREFDTGAIADTSPDLTGNVSAAEDSGKDGSIYIIRHGEK